MAVRDQAGKVNQMWLLIMPHLEGWSERSDQDEQEGNREPGRGKINDG